MQANMSYPQAYPDVLVAQAHVPQGNPAAWSPAAAAAGMPGQVQPSQHPDYSVLPAAGQAYPSYVAAPYPGYMPAGPHYAIPPAGHQGYPQYLAAPVAAHPAQKQQKDPHGKQQKDPHGKQKHKKQKTPLEKLWKKGKKNGAMEAASAMLFGMCFGAFAADEAASELEVPDISDVVEAAVDHE